MSEKLTYISVILPLKLDWEPCYWTTLRDIRVGQRVRVTVGGKEYVGVVSEVGIVPTVSPAKIKGIIGIEPDLADVSDTEISLWKAIADYYLCTIGEVYKAAYPAMKVVAEQKKRARKDMVAADWRERLDSAYKSLQLSPAQTRAATAIASSFEKKKPALIGGVTGSGKTEIYINFALQTLLSGQNVAYFVPEIALSRQLEERLRTFFGDRLLVFHSAETALRRMEVADFIRGNNGYIVLGTRSSIFLPHHNLGLIVLDEEQDSSYKQDSPAPHYNGRDCALMLSAIMNTLSSDAGQCNVLLGSATPSLETIYNCKSGKYTQVRLDERYYHSPDTSVEIIDTIAERKKHGMIGSFSVKLVQKIKSCVGSGAQVMILRNRRGYSPVLQCTECGYIPRCPHCNVSLTYHKDTGKVLCHHCGYNLHALETCPKCGGKFEAFGSGTQKIEEEAAALFPTARIARLDADVAQSKRTEKEIIKQFSNGEIDILIGTQIVAKGFDFDKLSLVAVLQADTLLVLQDFRADEKALQTLVQLSGRCARRGQKGQFIIQTSQPEHPVYKSLVSVTDPDGKHITELLAEREMFRYPPYTRLINILVKHSNEARADSIAKKLAGILRDFRFDGPFSPAGGKNAGVFVRCIRVILDKDKGLQDKKAELVRKIDIIATTEHCADNIQIDVDPI